MVGLSIIISLNLVKGPDFLLETLNWDNEYFSTFEKILDLVNPSCLFEF